MEIVLTSLIILILSYLSTCQIINIYKGVGRTGVRTVMPPYIIISCVFTLFTECIDGNVTMIPVSLTMSIASVSILSCTFSMISENQIKYISIAVIIIEVLFGVVNLMEILISIPDIPVKVTNILILAIVTGVALIFMYNIYLKLRDVKYLMKIGSVWSFVCICVDSIYIITLFIATFLSVYFGLLFCYPIFLSLFILALLIRIRDNSVFVLWRVHENRIVESMKISNLEIVGDAPGVDILYKSIYDRIMEYFDNNKPYLNNDLTINDVADVVFTNKLYISKAISHYTGRNFCQFVNYHRVYYSIELFRKNPHLKIVEMANQSGFNSAVSFSTAFRLFMSEKPGDWCRRERVRLDKKKK